MAVAENVKHIVAPAHRAWRRARSVVPVRDRYLLRAYLFAYVVCAFSFLGLYIGAEVLSRIKKFLEPHGMPLWKVLVKYYAVMVPVAYTYYLGPLLTLSGGMFALTLLNKNNEIMPLKAAGVSLYRIVAPIFGLSLCFSALTFLSQELLIPSMRDSIREVYGYSHTTRSIEKQVVFDSKGNEFTITRYWPAQKRGEDVVVTEREFSAEQGKMIIRRELTADYLYWEPLVGRTGATEGQWVLKPGAKGPIHESIFDDAGEPVVRPGEKLPYREHIRLVIDTDLIPEDFEAAGENAQHLSLHDIRRKLARSNYADTSLNVKLHQHFSFPLSHVVLLLIGIPFVLNQNNRSIFLGVLVSILICVGFYLVNAICTELGAKGVLQPLVAAWLPILFFMGLGSVLFDNLRS